MAAKRVDASGLGESEKLNAAKVPKITDGLTAQSCGHMPIGRTQIYKKQFAAAIAIEARREERRFIFVIYIYTQHPPTITSHQYPNVGIDHKM